MFSLLYVASLIAPWGQIKCFEIESGSCVAVKGETENSQISSKKDFHFYSEDKRKSLGFGTT